MRLISFRLALLCSLALTSVGAPVTADSDQQFRIEVDATDTVHKVFSVTEFIPLHGQTSVTLLYPEWETASHAPTVSVADLAGLALQLDGKPLQWHRDPVDVHAFHVSLPHNAPSLEVRFQYLSPLRGGVVTRSILQIQWQHMVLYPRGIDVNKTPVVAQVCLPTGFHAASSLSVEHENGSIIRFRQTSVAELVDAPVFAGRFMRYWTLATGRDRPVGMHVVADEAQDLAVSSEQIEALRKFVALTNAMFGTPPFQRYEFLVSVSDQLPNDGGTEHQQSSEISLPAEYFRKPVRYKAMASLFAHEYVHAWNGLAHRPVGLIVPDFNTPMQNSMLWVYEGLTELWGLQLTRESGLISDQDYRDLLAMDAAEQAYRPGAAWKSLADSDYDPVYLAGHHITWRDWERREDYYTEGPLLWLGVDAQIRRSTNGRKTLKNFARAFFRVGTQGTYSVSGYTFDDLTAGLNRVAEFPWQDYLQAQLNAHDANPILDALKEAGYRLVFTAVESELFAEQEQEDRVLDLSYSIGVQVRENGTVESVSWNGVAFEAGMVPGEKISAVDGEKFSFGAIRNHVALASQQSPIRLTVTTDSGQVEELKIAYNSGLRFPHLVTDSH